MTAKIKRGPRTTPNQWGAIVPGARIAIERPKPWVFAQDLVAGTVMHVDPKKDRRFFTVQGDGVNGYRESILFVDLWTGQAQVVAMGEDVNALLKARRAKEKAKKRERV